MNPTWDRSLTVEVVEEISYDPQGILGRLLNRGWGRVESNTSTSMLAHTFSVILLIFQVKLLPLTQLTCAGGH